MSGGKGGSLAYHKRSLLYVGELLLAWAAVNEVYPVLLSRAGYDVCEGRAAPDEVAAERPPPEAREISRDEHLIARSKVSMMFLMLSVTFSLVSGPIGFVTAAS